MSMKAVSLLLLRSFFALVLMSTPLGADRKKSVTRGFPLSHYCTSNTHTNRCFVGVISGDSLVLRGRPGPQGQPPKER